MSEHSSTNIEDILNHTAGVDNEHDLDVDLESLLNDDEGDDSPVAPLRSHSRVDVATSSSSRGNSDSPAQGGGARAGLAAAAEQSAPSSSALNVKARSDQIDATFASDVDSTGPRSNTSCELLATPLSSKEAAFENGDNGRSAEGSFDGSEGGVQQGDELLSADSAHTADLERLTAAETSIRRFVEGGHREPMRQAGGGSGSSDGSSGSNVSWACMDALTGQLKKNETYKHHGPGPATRVKVTNSYIAVGTAKGLLLLFDHDQELRQVLGSSVSPASRASSAVTSVDIDKAESTALLGHLSGELALWDLVKGALLKRVVDLHSRPVTHLDFLRYATEGLAPAFAQPDAADQSCLDCVSLDTRGIMHKVRFTKHMLWTTYSSESECLLDGNVGAILDMTCLPPLTASRGASARESAAAPMPGLQLVAIHTAKKTYVVQIRPAVKVLHRWADGSASPCCAGISYISWSWNVEEFVLGAPGSASDSAVPKLQFNPLLARYTGNTVQILSVTLVRNRSDAGGLAFVPAFNVAVEGSLSPSVADTILAVTWAQNSQLVLLTTKKIVFMTNTLEVVDKCELDGATADKLAALSLGADDGDGGAPLALAPSLVSHAAKVYLLSGDAVHSSHLKCSENWLDQPLQLISRGRVLDAVAASITALSLRDGGAARGDVAFLCSKVEQHLPQMLSLPSQPSGSDKQLLSHYKLVAELCVEYCCLTDSTDLLFGALFDAFSRIGQDAVYLHALEPYILSRQLTAVPPQVLAALVASLAAAPQRSTAVERLLCFLSPCQLDCAHVAAVLLKHKMHMSFLYTYSLGLLNFAEAFQVLFDHMLKLGPGLVGAAAAAPTQMQSEVSYKLLLFVRYSAAGLIFPRGERISTISLQALADLCEALLDTSYSYSYTDRASRGAHADSATETPGPRARFPYLTALSRVDSVGTVVVAAELLAALAAEGRATYALSAHSSLTQLYIALYDFCAYADSNDITRRRAAGSQTSQIAAKADAISKTSTSFFERKYFYKTFSHLVTLQQELPCKMLIAMIKFSSWHSKSRYEIENSLLALFSRQIRANSIGGEPAAHGSAALVVATLKEHGFWRVAALYSGFPHKGTELFTPTEIYEVAVERFLALLNPEGESAAKQLFAYVNMICDGGEAVDDSGVEGGAGGTAHKFCRYLEHFARINTEDTMKLVGRHLCAHAAKVVACTEANTRLQYDLLEEIALHDLATSSDQRASRGGADAGSAERPAALGPRELLTYIGLMIRYAPRKTYPFFTTVFPDGTNSYSANPYCGGGYNILDECLELCERYGCADAYAYLLERKGDVAAALRVLCADFSRTMISSRVALEKSVTATNRSGDDSAFLADCDDLFGDLQHILQCLVSLCCRNDGFALLDPLSGVDSLLEDEGSSPPSSMLAGGESSKRHLLWQTTFDFLLSERMVLPAASAIDSLGIFSRVNETLMRYFRSLLRTFMNEMKFHVPAKAVIVSLMRSNNHVIRYDEFKDVTTSMIESYSREITLRETVNRLMQTDVSQCYKLKYLRRRAGRRMQPRNAFSEEEASSKLAVLLRRSSKVDAVSNRHVDKLRLTLEQLK